jgi:phosphate starvation-inducible PhoH-like protein
MYYAIALSLAAAVLCSGFIVPTHRPIHSDLASAKKRLARQQIPEESRHATFAPKNANQRTYVAHLNDPSVHIVVAHGPAGTGKTLLACAYAAQELLGGRIKRVVLTRPTVAVEDEQLGFLPGGVAQKMAPYTQPLLDALQEICSKRELAAFVAAGAIEVAPLAFMRGRTFKDAIVIADEMQNSTPGQMLMVATRLGTNSKLIITGDLQQSDRAEDNGLADLLAKMHVYEKWAWATGACQGDMRNIALGDVLRARIVKSILALYDGSYRLAGDEPILFSHDLDPTLF